MAVEVTPLQMHETIRDYAVAYHMMSREELYINGEWVAASGEGEIEVINPATEQVIGSVPVGSQADVDAAVNAASAVFPSWSQSSLKIGLAILTRFQQPSKTEAKNSPNLSQQKLAHQSATAEWQWLGLLVWLPARTPRC